MPLIAVLLFLSEVAPAQSPPRPAPTVALAAGKANRIVLIGVDGCIDEAHVQQLRELGSVSSYGPMNEIQAIDRLKGANVAIMNPYLVPVTRTVLEGADALKLIVLSITGFDRIVVSGMTTANPLLTLDNVVVSPHTAYHSRESRTRCAESAVRTVRTFLTPVKN